MANPLRARPVVDDRPKAVVILGAGSSAPFNVPVLSQVFKDPYAERYLRRNEFLADALQRTFWEPRGLNLETSDDGPTIEDILTMVRDSEDSDWPGAPLLGEEHDRFRRGLYVLICESVWRGKHTRDGYLNPLIGFARTHFSHTTWATFNWDSILEASFWYSSGPPGGRRNPRVTIDLDNWFHTTRSHTILKLHGGVSWWCFTDGRRTVLRYVGFASEELIQRWGEYDRAENPIAQPLLLEPSAHKYEGELFRNVLRPQWHALARALAEADYVIILGYSLPPADAMARSVILLGFQYSARSQWLAVDVDPRICETYRRLLGRTRLATRSVATQDFCADVDDQLYRAFPGLRR